MTTTGSCERNRQIADVMARLPRCRTYTDLLGYAIAAVADIAVADAHRNGVAAPNRAAVLNTATDVVLHMWQTDLPKLWAGYCKETGLAGITG